MDRKEIIKKMLDAIIAGQEEQAQVHFHSYATAITPTLLGREPAAPIQLDDDDGETE